MSDEKDMTRLEQVDSSKSRDGIDSRIIDTKAPSHGNHTHEAHHLKWGQVSTSGFAPPSVNEDDLISDVDDVCHRHTPDREHRRRKMTRDRSMEALDAEARRIHAQRRYLLRRPRAQQYFRGNTLVRSDEERSSGRLELFFDLTFVGIIAVLAEEAVAEPTGASLVRYLITYTAAYNIWSSMREIFNAFYNDDISQKILVLFIMSCLVIYGNNATKVQQDLSQGPARAATIASYLLAELSLYSTFIYYSFHIKAFRAQLRFHTAIWLIAAALYIGSIFVNVKSAVAMAVVALAIEVIGWPLAYSRLLVDFLRLRYLSAINIEHEIERYNDFYTLVIGEFIFSLFSGSPVGSGVHIAALRAVLAVVIAFCFQLMYMQSAGSKRITHALRYSRTTATLFFLLHIPIVSALTLCGDSMAEFIREDHVSQALRWIACESYAIGMIGNWCLSYLECERDEKGELWLPKWARLSPRLMIGIVAIFLPFTKQKMEAEAEYLFDEGEGTSGVDIDTTKLLAILASMSAFALLWEQVTSLDGPNAPHEVAGDNFIEIANDGHTTKAALSTISWRGYPAFVEPGAGTFDCTHQREHLAHAEDKPQPSNV